MHRYLRAIGFSEPMNALDSYNLIDDVIEKATHRAYITDEQDDNSMFAELRMELGDGYGVCVVGIFDEQNSFNCEALFPYLISESVSSLEEVSVEERIEGHTYAGVVDELSVGSTMIFRLLNCVDFLKYGAPQVQPIPGTSVSLSALSIEGTVMLPIQKSEAEIQELRESERSRRNLMNKARRGDEEAVNSLSSQDIEIYSVLMDKLQQDDVYTLVDSTFMPTGVECDLYSVLGEIIECIKTQNLVTLDRIYLLTIMCGNLRFRLCINEKDLYGDPAPGRRFKGVVWMQGIINFPEGKRFGDH